MFESTIMSLIPLICEHRPLAMRSDQRFNQVVPRNFFKPWENMLRQIEEITSGCNQMGLKNTSISNNEKFQISIDVQHFGPEEISVKVINNFIVVEAKHEERQDEHGFISRRFLRRYPLPKGCLPDTVKSSLSCDGVLTVVAPKILPMPSTGERIVPIIQTGPVKKEINSD